MTVKKPVARPASRPVAPPAAKPAPRRRTPAAKAAPPTGADLDAAILRFLRAKPNQAVDLAPLAADLGVDPFAMQLAVERLHARRFVVAPFIEPGTAGGAELTAEGLRWLIGREGGKPKDKPVAFKMARERVLPELEAARLPRAQVYGVRR